jgi:hypothetical protein
MHGNPWLRLLRREVEELVRSRQGEQYLREYWPGMSPGANAGSRVADGVNLLGVEGLKDLPAPRKVRCKVAMPTPARREISAIDISAPGSANAERAAAPWLAGEPGISGRALARRCTTS